MDDRRRAGLWLPAAALLLCAGFAALGAWQVQRLAWKQALVVRVESRVHAAPVKAPGPAAWPGLTRDSAEYLRVSVQGRFDHDRETLVRASTVLGTGYWVLTPLRTDEGYWLLVNRGFVPPEQRAGGRRAAPSPAGAQRVSGWVRLSEPGGGLLQANVPAHERWYSRDVAAIAAARGLSDAPVAPYFIDAVAGPGADAAAWPRPGLTVLAFSNNHLVYAATWFVLAAMSAGAAAWLVIDVRRRAEDPPTCP